MRVWSAAALWVGLSVAAGAQQGRAHAADGRTRETMESIMVLPTPGASFSATVVTEWTRLLPDGSKETVKNRRTVARDSSGRVFQERRFSGAPTATRE